MISLVQLYNEIKVNDPVSLLNFIKQNKNEIIDDVNENGDEEEDDYFGVDPEKVEVVKDSLGDVSFSGSGFDNKGISFRWLKDIDDEFKSEGGNVYTILKIKGREIAYIEYNV